MRSAKLYHRIEITCSKDIDWFDTNFDDLPQVEQDIILARNGIPCSCTSTLGDWCKDCPFVTKYMVYEYEDDNYEN